MKIKIGKKIIGDDMPPYIVAEIGINHEGNFNKCKELLVSAKKAGSDAVKLQTLNPEENYIPNSKSYKLFEISQLSNLEIKKVFAFAKKINLDIFSTSGDKETVDYIDKLNPCAHKISSGLLTHLPLIKYTAKKGKPLIISTGMGSKKEIMKAVKTAIETGNKKIVLLHCVSMYPTNHKNLNLKTIIWLKKNFKHLIGYSDHSTSIEIPSFASVLGACMVEKHFTLDINKKGFDHKISFNEKKFKQMTELIRLSFLTLGTEEKKLTLSEQKNKIKYRRYIVANENIKKGSILRKSNISIKRVLNGINGLEPAMIDKLYGRKSLKNIKKNTLIKKKFINLR